MRSTTNLLKAKINHDEYVLNTFKSTIVLQSVHLYSRFGHHSIRALSGSSFNTKSGKGPNCKNQLCVAFFIHTVFLSYISSRELIMRECQLIPFNGILHFLTFVIGKILSASFLCSFLKYLVLAPVGHRVR